jgi:hypothetical protein
MKTIKTNSNAKYIISLIILFALILACGKSKDSSSDSSGKSKDQSTNSSGKSKDESTNSNSTKRSEESPIIKVSALQLYTDYDANEVSADNKYKGKILQVSGIVGEIRKDFTNNIIVELKVGDIFKKVDCRFGKDNSETADLSKGQKVTVLGTCSGFLLKSVQLKECSIQ